MNIRPSNSRAREQAWAILVVMSLAATALVLLASVMSWSNENSTVVARNNETFSTLYAAEAATEKVLSAVVQDDQNYGEGWVFNMTGNYRSMIPSSSDNPYWTNFQFSGGTAANSVIVTETSASTSTILGPPFEGLSCVGATYEIIANAQNVTTLYGIVATVGQQILLGQVPIFQFAIFYNDFMEVQPGANMNITGLVHGNTNIIIGPNSGVTLTFSNDVSSTGSLATGANVYNSGSSGTGTVVFNGTDTSDVQSMNLPVGTNTSGTTTNVGQNVYAILQVPPIGESPNSAVGTNRLFNQVDMIIVISNGNAITVTSGVNINGQATVISNSQWANFISTNGTFYNGREGTAVDPVDINIGALREWSATNTVLRPVLAAAPARSSATADVQSIFVADMRFLSNTVIVTNITYTTNTSTMTTSNYPATNAYIPPVTTNTILTTSPTYPTSNFVPPVNTTNTSSVTTVGYPTNGTYITPPPVSTNTTVTTTTNRPNSGYLGSITTNKNNGNITGYTYDEISSYTYDLISGYIYNGITGYTYAGITGVTTNINYVTNYTEFAEPGIVLTNGAALPSNGLSVVTPDPAYVVGNWNVTTNTTSSGAPSNQTLQSAQVTNTLPSAIYTDAISILSPAWSPLNSSNSISSRVATGDTVNAAILTGNVPSDSNNYSGGVENYLRLLENWSGVDLYYNGSMVEMFQSQIGNAPWPGTGTIYNPPTRVWAFDTNFSNPSTLPPLTPKVIYIQRAQWTSLPPHTTSF
jgi:hypothetical protein